MPKTSRMEPKEAKPLLFFCLMLPPFPPSFLSWHTVTVKGWMVMLQEKRKTLPPPPPPPFPSIELVSHTWLLLLLRRYAPRSKNSFFSSQVASRIFSVISEDVRTLLACFLRVPRNVSLSCLSSSTLSSPSPPPLCMHTHPLSFPPLLSPSYYVFMHVGNGKEEERRGYFYTPWDEEGVVAFTLG